MRSRAPGAAISIGCLIVLLASSVVRADEAISVSMVDLLANERLFTGRVIEVFGYLGMDMALYLTRDHAEALDRLSAVSVADMDKGEITSSKCIGSYVRVRGRLLETDPESFTLTDVRQIYQTSSESVCWKRSS